MKLIQKTLFAALVLSSFSSFAETQTVKCPFLWRITAEQAAVAQTKTYGELSDEMLPVSAKGVKGYVRGNGDTDIVHDGIYVASDITIYIDSRESEQTVEKIACYYQLVNRFDTDGRLLFGDAVLLADFDKERGYPGEPIDFEKDMRIDKSAWYRFENDADVYYCAIAQIIRNEADYTDANLAIYRESLEMANHCGITWRTAD